MDGKKQKDVRLLKEGKNLDRCNSTTAEEQAMLEAESKWKKQLDKGYKESLENINEEVFLPMLAHKFIERKKYIQWPCYAQQKLDGIRCFARVIDGEVILTSRNGKRFPHMEHLFEDIKSFPNIENIVLDGELYSDIESFNTVVGLVKKEKLTEEDKIIIKNINLRMYDCIILTNLEEDFENRWNLIEAVFDNTLFKYICRISSVLVNNETEAFKKHDTFVQNGFEGLILRNRKGAYELNKRSNNLQKYKNFFDDEFEIHSFKEGDGRDLGTVVWICKNKNDKTGLNPLFNVRPRGSNKIRKEWFESGSKYIGKQLTVRYQEINPETGCPRFPVGISVRDYE
jgi:DNA ligase-1